jgi:very-short-patch-repair endonuclease
LNGGIAASITTPYDGTFPSGARGTTKVRPEFGEERAEVTYLTGRRPPRGHSAPMTKRRDSLLRARRLATRQRNLITFEQARQCGLSSHEIRGLVRRAEWDRVFRGVFSIAASEPVWQQMALAACFTAGRGVATSHETAAALMDLDGIGTPQGTHLSTVRRLKIGDPSVTIHQTSRPFAIRRVRGIPATVVERVLLDLAATHQHTIELGVEDALRRGLTTTVRLEQTIARDGGKGRPGARLLGELVEAHGASPATESELEAKVWRALGRARLSGMVKQHVVTRPNGSSARMDLAFPQFRIAVEVDGYRWHSGRQAWHRDLARRNDLLALGWTVVHATKEDVDDGCRTLVSTLRELMGMRSLPLDRQ